MNIDRRDFVKKAAMAGVGTAAIASQSKADEMPIEKTKKRSPNDAVRLGFIGVGNRGSSHLRNAVNMEKTEVVAICDISERSLAEAKRKAGSRLGNPKIYTGNDFAYLDMLEKEQLDAVIISTPWDWHAKMAVAAMKAGAYTGIEVPACTTLEEAWDLVNTHEETGVHLMFMENANYSQNMLAVLNMVRQDVFGELLHCRCGYLHDLRGVKFNDGNEYNYKPGRPLKFGEEAYAEAQWRGLHSIRRNGDLYPTHGIGPVAVLLDINNGNRFTSLSSFATKARGLKKYVDDYGGPNHPLSKIKWNCGDIVTSTITCANGETVMVTHDCNSPRPYHRDLIVQGTKGIWYNDWSSIYIEHQSEKDHQWDNHDSWIQKYNHKYWREEGERASSSGHGGTDYMLLRDFLGSVRENKPAPLDVYDAATWSAISALSEMSIARGNHPVDFPDFTRGRWVRYNEDRVFARDEKFPVLTNRYLIY